jgi:hypothetical protein
MEALFLVFCRCSGLDVSLAVEKLEQQKTLSVLGVDLTC